MSKHAILSASSAERWIHCPPSVRLSEKYEDAPSSYAAEGTDAHALCEYKLKSALGMKAEDPLPNLTYYNLEMEDAALGYADYVLEQIEVSKKECSDPTVLIEQRVDFSKWVNRGYGTADCIIAADGTVKVLDFKYGLGVQVSAKNNAQMMCYALGALIQLDGIYDIENVCMTIYQPRRDNLSACEISKEELLRWADEVLKPAAQLAFAGEGDFRCGEWCRFCKAKAVCRKRAEYNLELAKYDFKMPAELENLEIAAIMAKSEELAAWAADVKEYALRQALSGVEYEGWKLVEGRSNRKYTSEPAVAKAVSEAGYDPYEQKLLGVTAMQKLLGKTRFEKLLSGFIEKPKGKPTLVPESDKRAAMNNAKFDFEEEK